MIADKFKKANEVLAQQELLMPGFLTSMLKHNKAEDMVIDALDKNLENKDLLINQIIGATGNLLLSKIFEIRIKKDGVAKLKEDINRIIDEIKPNGYIKNN